MKYLIPPSEGKAKIQRPQDVLFKDTNFIYERYVKQVVRLLNLIDKADINRHFIGCEPYLNGLASFILKLNTECYEKVKLYKNQPKTWTKHSITKLNEI